MIVPALRASEPLPSIAPIETTPSGPVLPRGEGRRDRVLPLLVVLSLLAHVAVVAPSLFHRSPVAQSPREIPVELVQLPPAPPKPAAPKSTPSKPSAPKAAPPKAEQPKPAPPKQEPKQPPKQQQPQKQQPQKQEAPKPRAQKIEQAEPQRPAAAPSGSERYKSLIGAMPAIALPGASGDGTDQVSYSQLVLSHVAKAKKEGRFRGMPGAASVAFTIDDNGGIASVEIVRPSGIADLDAEAIAMIRRGAPYPPPPPGGRRDYTITLRFQPLI